MEHYRMTNLSDIRMVCLSAFIAIVGLGVPHKGFAQENYAQMPCPLTLPWDGEVEGETYDCGVVTVPENHDIPDGRQIELTFLRLHTTTLAPEPDPLVYLSGGPGGSALHEITATAMLYANMQSIRQRRDVLFFDQRGTGHSTLIACGPMSAAIGVAAETMDIGDVTMEELEEVIAGEGDMSLVLSICATGYASEGVDLAQFNSISSAHDIAALTEAIGYAGDYNLYGTSYGTRLAQVAMQETPERLRAVVLDGTVSPAVAGTAETTTKVRYHYDTIFDLCEADAFCSETYPGLRDRFIAVLEELADEPLVFDPPMVPNAALRTRFGVIDQIEPKFFADFGMLNNKIARGGYAAYLPVIIGAMENRDIDLLRDILGRGPVEEEVEAQPPLGLEDAFRPDDVFIAPALNILIAMAKEQSAEEPAGLAADWIGTVVDELAARLRDGDAQAEVIGDFVEMAILPVHGPDAARLIEFADVNLSEAAGRRANALVDAMTATDLRLTMWAIGDIAEQMGGTGERGMAFSMLLGINCIEEVNFTPISYVEDLIATNPYPGVQLRGLLEYRLTQVICDFWPSPFQAEDIMYPGESQIPALVYAQGLDTQTPVQFGEDVAELLPNSFYHEWSTEGHVIASRSPNSCPGDIAAAFLDDPSSEPNFACANDPYYTLPFELAHEAFHDAQTE